MTRRTTAVLVLAVALGGTLVTSGCGSSEPSVAVSGGPTASTAPAAGAELGAVDFAAALHRPGTTIVDVRTPQEFADGHLAGAVNIDVSSPDFAARLSALDPGAPYAVYCRSGNRSAAALAAMSQLGFSAAYHLGGGIGAWQEAGGEVVTG